MNKLQVFLTAVCLASLVLASDPLAIDSISNSATQHGVVPVTSSLRGGKEVYIQARGFDAQAADIKIELVSVNSGVEAKMADCTVPADGVLDDSITCVTGDYGQNTNSDNLYVRLTSNGKRVTTSGSNKVVFNTDNTPYLNNVYPTAGTGGRRVLFSGTHRLTDRGDGQLDMGDLRHLKLGNDICNTLDIAQPDDTAQLVCNQSKEQEAGHYMIE